MLHRSVRRPGVALRCLLIGALAQARVQAGDDESARLDSALLEGIAVRDRALETDAEADWQRALDDFARAVERHPSKEALFEFAEAAAHLELCGEAYAAYESVLSLGIEGKAEARAREFLATHAIWVGRIEIAGPSGAVVFVDGRRRGVLPLERPLVVTAGARQIRLERSGFQSWEQQVGVDSGALVRLAPSLALVAGAVTLPQVAVQPLPLELPADGETWEVPTAIGGGVLLLAGVASFAISSAALPDARRTLEAKCDLFEAGECSGARADRRQAAQAAADHVRSFETVRWVSLGGAVVGLAASAVAVFALVDGGSAEPVQRAELLLSEHALGVHWWASF